MDEAVIIQALEQAGQGLGLYFQIIPQAETLYIYINRPTDLVLDYPQLTATLLEAIASLDLPEIQSVNFYSRVLGEVEPDWQTTASLLVQEAVPSEDLANLNPPVEDSELEPIHEGDTPPPPVEQEDTATEILVAAASPDPPVPDAHLEFNPEDDSFTILSEYCFIRNRSLVTSELLPPEATVAALVQTFHDLSDAEKLAVLPCLEKFFKSQRLEESFQPSDAIADFFSQISALTGDEIRKASIWLSRYCHNPELTLAQTAPVLNPQRSQTLSPETVAEVQESEQTLSPSTSTQSYRRAQPTYTESSTSRKTQNALPEVTVQVLLIPLLWVVFTLGIVCYNVQANNGPGAIAQVCTNAKEPDHCKLAAQIAGIDTIATFSKQTQPSEPKVAEMAAHLCERQGALNAGQNIKAVVDNEPNQIQASRQSTHEIFPGLFVIDTSHLSLEDGTSTVRTACVYGTVENKMTHLQLPKPLAGEVIPNEWPQAPIKTKPYHLKVADAQSVHGILTLLGTNTLFTAFGLFVVLFLNLGVRIESLNSLYIAAFIFGTVDAMMSLIPIVGTFGMIRFTAVPVVGLMITSVFVKGMKVDFSGGYKVLALAGGILIGIRFLLNWLLFTTILSFLG
jgi:hypothetical protein